MTPTAAFSPAVTRATTRLEPPTDHSFTVAVHPWDAAKWIGERIGLPAGMAGRVYERGPASYRVEVANGSDGAVQSLMDFHATSLGGKPVFRITSTWSTENLGAARQAISIIATMAKENGMPLIVAQAQDTATIALLTRLGFVHQEGKTSDGGPFHLIRDASHGLDVPITIREQRLR